MTRAEVRSGVMNTIDGELWNASICTNPNDSEEIRLRILKKWGLPNHAAKVVSVTLTWADEQPSCVRDCRP